MDDKTFEALSRILELAELYNQVYPTSQMARDIKLITRLMDELDETIIGTNE
jgi:hypothetical protein